MSSSRAQFWLRHSTQYSFPSPSPPTCQPSPHHTRAGWGNLTDQPGQTPGPRRAGFWVGGVLIPKPPAPRHPSPAGPPSIPKKLSGRTGGDFESRFLNPRVRLPLVSSGEGQMRGSGRPCEVPWIGFLRSHQPGGPHRCLGRGPLPACLLPPLSNPLTPLLSTPSLY